VYRRIQLLEEWVNMLDALTVEYKALELAWKKLATDLAASARRWLKVKGMVGVSSRPSWTDAGRHYLRTSGWTATARRTVFALETPTC
jgi:hypothetical protein